MNKYSYIALLIMLIIGITVGAFLESSRSRRESSYRDSLYAKALIKSITKSDLIIDSLSREIEVKNILLQEDVFKIEDLQLEIRRKDKILAKQRDEVKSLTAKQKEKWIVSRYDTLELPFSKDSIQLSDPVVGEVIDELIVKDNLLIRTILQDSIINTYKHKDSILFESISQYKFKEVEYNIIIENKEALNKQIIKENNNLEREIRKERLKKNSIKALAVVEAAIIILILL